MDWIKAKMTEVEQEMNSTPERGVSPSSGGTHSPPPPTGVDALPSSATHRSDSGGSDRASRSSSARSSRSTSGVTSSIRKMESNDVEVDLSQMLGNADSPTPTKPKAKAPGSAPATPSDGGNVKKLKMMALKFKKENETLKASLVSAQKSLQTANARTAELEGASQTSPELQKALDAAEAAVQEAKAESQKTKKMALALKKKNSQLTEQLAEQTKQDTQDHAAPAMDSAELATLQAKLQEIEANMASLTAQLATSRAETADKAAELKAAASKHTAEIDQTAAELATLRSELAAAKDVTTNGSASSPPPSSDNKGAVTADAVQAAAVHRALEVAVDELRAELAESTRSEETLRAEVEFLRAQALENAAGNGAVVADTVVDDAELVALRAEVAALKANVETANGGDTTADEAAALQEAVDSTAQALRAEHEAEVTVMMQSIEAAQSKAGKLQEELDVKDGRVNELGAKVAQLGKELAEAQRTAADQLGALGNEIEALRNDKEQFTTDGEEASDAIKELATECTALRTEVQQLQVAKARLETSLSNEKEAVAAVKAKLAAANAGASQQTMLDLELADYKRTAESLNSRISELEEQLASARMQNEDAEAKVADAASTQAKEDELKKKGEDSRIKMKAMLFQFKKELTERRAEGEKSDKAQRELQAQLEMQTQAVESLKTEFAELNTHLTVVEAEKRELETSKDVAMHSVKFELETVRRDLQHAQSQSTESSRELSSYKARAHTLLKQKQDDDQTTTKADLDRKVATLTEIREQLAAAQADCATANAQIAEAEAEVDEVSAKVEQLRHAAEQQQQSTTAKVQALQDAAVSTQEEHMETLSQLRMEHSMLLRTHRDKHTKIIAEVEKREEELRKEVYSLRAQLSSAEADVETSAVAARAAGQRSGLAGSSDSGSRAEPGSPAPTAPHLARNAAAAATAEARSTPASNTRGQTDLATKVSDLATLLVTPAAEAADEQTEADAKLASAKKHIEHMATLLADSESSCERLAEQSKVLKTEIRRHEANATREKGSNLEYIKNVVYKFITAEEEREQLIPVLGMLLHFSADEVKEATKNYMRIRAAQAQKNTDASGGESSWGVFPRWS